MNHYVYTVETRLKLMYQNNVMSMYNKKNDMMSIFDIGLEIL